ncbi:PDZ domain-containing protein [candidate division WOR-3 bacterium]|nr:PDZ domain-containing protein [candidate division WOR-3 bacterium]
MSRSLVLMVFVAAVAGLACRRAETGSPLGATYGQVARPAVWRVLPRSQAEACGLQPGDVILSYGDEPVRTTAELLQMQLQMAAGTRQIPLTVLRGDAEVGLQVEPGELGLLPEAERYTGSLALAAKDVLSHFGSSVDYDWLAALTGESFVFTARCGGCPGTWPGDVNRADFIGLTAHYGLALRLVYAADTNSSRGPGENRQRALSFIRERLTRGRVLLVWGNWPGTTEKRWGVAARCEPGDSLVRGYTPGWAGEVATAGPIDEVYEVEQRVLAEPDPDDLLTAVLTRAIEMGRTAADTGWQSGIAAYDVWIGRLDTVPFCSVCPDSGVACFDRLIWTLLANKESANRFLEDMREALPESGELIGDIIANNNIILAKLNGVMQSRVRPGTWENQQKLARVVNEIQLVEAALLWLYEDLIGEL